MKAIYKFECSVGRMGDLYGLFVAENDEVSRLIASKREVYFGEVLGKHSEIFGPIDEDDVTMISDDQDLVEKVQTLKMEVGYNPVQIDKDFRQ